MRIPTIASLGALLLAATAGAQTTPPGETLERLSGFSERELSRSVAELNELRERVASEKLPLSQEFTTLETKVGALRKEHDSLTREVDEGHLQSTRIDKEIQARRDELSYVTNLLDEYARGYEAKLGAGENQVQGLAIERAKEATENDTLSDDERFDRQLALITASITRIDDAIGGLRFPGTGVDLQGSVASGTFAVLGPVSLFSARGGAAGMVVPQAGSPNPLIRPLEGAAQAGLALLVDTGEGLLPLDPTRGGALQALIQRTNLIHIFEKGGPIMWPLLAASILAMGTVLERVLFLLAERRKRDPKAVESLFSLAEHGDFAGAIAVGEASRDTIARTLSYALGHKSESFANALLYAQGQELKRFRRGIPILDTVITLAPLLGLLGTVTGMMGSFSLIGGELSAPGAITGGIAEALIATAFGLGIAITALLPFNFLNSKFDEARHEIESASAQLELIVKNQDATSEAAEEVTNGSPRADREEIHRRMATRVKA